ncbi:hypothetical protein BJD78_gp79 [Arthrobacter phage KellEzio]|uniref:Uncharacterized protein n=1 Tax=Arthrobacter phage KellEzio TaxID=1796995 RepID=A0A140G6G4_9CAUD|nr:hypothetical protein BJD78_gp79 [Arthrobacter phage KellEzio]AMM44249.1 hypothetical protein KELLEZIO_79 [Arthrobacter phage KellEzio]
MHRTLQVTVKMTLELPEKSTYDAHDLAVDLHGGIVRSIERVIPAEVVSWTTTPVNPLEG